MSIFKMKPVTIKILLAGLVVAFLTLPSVGMAAESEGHHLPHNHLALIVGTAIEHHDDHEEAGALLGVEYERQYSEKWGIGGVFEQEAFGDRTNRHAILALPISYHVNKHWRLFVAPGLEFSSPGDADKALLRFGTGYEFNLGRHMTFAPEFLVDFVSGGAQVYVFALTFGYGF